MPRRSRRRNRPTFIARPLRRRGETQERLTSKSTAGGHHLAANRDRGIGPLTAALRREASFAHFRRPSANDRMQTQQGTRGGQPKR